MEQDKIDALINQINKLNLEGKELSMSDDRNNLTEAIEKHKEAVLLADSRDISPDYLAYSQANAAYALRQRDNDKDLINVLENTLDDTNIAFDTNRYDETFFGRGFLLEEAGLVKRFNLSKDNPVSDLKEGLDYIEKSLELYEKASVNAENEIVDASVIYDKLFRTTGIASTISSDLSKITDGEEREKYLDLSVEYAQKEVDSRLEIGETEGRNLANAYHTLGSAKTELVDMQPELYESAKQDIYTAKKLVTSGLVQSVLNFRLAWLEYKYNPENVSVIEEYVDKVISDQEEVSKTWGPTVKAKLKEDMYTLGEHLGGDYTSRIDGMFLQ
ncbi:MAG: hypothetical protein KAR23_05005 [Candidatus Aenigmarchaeota archaeon]|nr:hypothetical protein [Candidatus Aenigmarchaeota archaeon]